VDCHTIKVGQIVKKKSKQISKIHTIREIAKKVRGILVKEFPQLNYTKMEGSCALASLVLIRVLKKNQIRAKIVYGTCRGYSHFWVKTKNGIWDITANQFGYKGVVFHSTFSSYYIESEDEVNWNYFIWWSGYLKPTKRLVITLAKKDGSGYEKEG
jgi:hypothetical protein